MIQAENSATAVMDIPRLDPSILAGDRMVMGDGMILGLSDNAMKIAGDSRVKSGIELALMVAWRGRMIISASQPPRCPGSRILRLLSTWSLFQTTYEPG
jgi:hypothetical protein